MVLSKSKFRNYIIAMMVVLFPAQLVAGKYAAEFLRIGVGARALGMGGAFVSIADDGAAAYWNPAGLGNIVRHQAYFSHVQMFDNLASHDYANFSIRLGQNLGFGLSWIRLAVDDIPRYPELQGTRYDRILQPELRSTGEPEGYFGDAEDAVFLSLAKSVDFDLAFGSGLLPRILPFNVSAGVSYKLISQKLDKSEGKGQGLDFGVKVVFGRSKTEHGQYLRKFAIGLTIQDAAGTTIAWNTANHTRENIPLNYMFGASYSQHIRMIDGQINLSYDRNADFGPSNHFGGEFIFKNIVAVRAGMNNKKITAGAGVKVFKLNVDYAFVSYDLGNSHRISGSFTF